MAVEQQTLPDTCPVEMAEGRLCERPIYLASGHKDPRLVCLMHSRDPDKHVESFLEEIEAILDGTSHWNPKDKLDFTRFVFPVADFSAMHFRLPACFAYATFIQAASFSGATFSQDAHFFQATFTQDAR